ncbi:MAG: photosystem II stability/assembly factor-like uncharacterized protein [Planctomycetota bacterium]|jgi:photosystem II stability/assembly factor-like uncharacterized protein
MFIMRLLASIGFALLAPFALSQSPIPAPNDHQTHPVWGGQSQTIHTMNTAQGQRIIVGTGGGAIRVSDPAIDAGAWKYVPTPTDFTGTLIDIEFLDESTGFACGRNGQILRTMNGGQSWADFGVPVLDPCGDLATIWSIQPLADDVVLACGLWLARYTQDGGQTWLPLELHDFDPDGGNEYDGSVISEAEFHFYDIEVVGGPTNFTAAMCGEFESPGGHVGVVMYTDAADANAIGGRKWQMVLDDSRLTQAQANGGETLHPDGGMREPWGLGFERGSAPGAAIGYVTGGEGTNHPGRVYRTTDGGKSWDHEKEITPSAYGISVEAEQVMVGAYSGAIWTRAASGLWSSNEANPLPGPADGLPFLTHRTTAAVNFVDSAGPGQYVIGGGFGLTMKTQDYGQSWQEANPYYDLDIYEQRLQGLDALDTQTAWVTGQLGVVMKTSDGGADWQLQRADAQARTLWEVEFHDANNGVAVGDNGALLYTLDGGVKWKSGQVPASSVATLHLRDVVMVDARRVWAVGSTNNGAPGVLHSRDGGALWLRVEPPQVNSLHLTGLVFPEPGAGIVIGWSGSSPGECAARAFVGKYNAQTGRMAWRDISPPQPNSVPGQNPVSRKLLGIDSAGDELASATIVAVGNGGMVLRWDGTRLVDVPAVYDMDGAGDVSFRELGTDFETVGVSPSGDTVLIGAQYDINLHHAADMGFMLKFDANWRRIKANTSKSLCSIKLTSDTDGFILGQTILNPTSGKGERSHHCDGYSDDDVEATSFDNPNLADPIIMRYIGN